MARFLSIETRGGEPISAAGYQITPFAQWVRIQIPGLYGGLIWNRPVSVLAVSPDGQEQVIPVRDATRLAQVGLLGGSVLAAMFFWLFFGKRRKS
jgi:hypothetical protein